MATQLPLVHVEMKVAAIAVALAIAFGLAYSSFSVIMSGGAGKNGSTVAVSDVRLVVSHHFTNLLIREKKK